MRVSALRSAGTYVAHLSRDRARRRCYIACARFVLQHWVLYVLQHLDMKGNLYFVLATRKMIQFFKRTCVQTIFLFTGSCPLDRTGPVGHFEHWGLPHKIPG